MANNNEKKFNSKKRSKGKKRYANNRDDRSVNPDVLDAKGNDFAWYTKNRGVVDTVGSVFFNTLYGYPRKSVDVAGGPGYTLYTGTLNRAVPGVAVANFIPWVDAKGTDTDAINVASQNFNTWTRHANSGSVNYQRSDQIQVLLAVSNIYMLVEVLKRDLRLATTYSAVNKYVFNALLLSMGYTQTGIDTLRANLANYTAQLNIVIQKTSTLVIPKDVPFIQRLKWLCANVFRDDQLHKASYYAFMPKAWWIYDWANAKCTLSTAAFGNTFVTRLATVQNLIDGLIAYDDIGTISGDILKAYKVEGCDKLEVMGLGETLQPSIDMEAINQIRNATLCGYSTAASYELQQVSSNSQLLQVVNNKTTRKGVYYGMVLSNQVDPNIVIRPRLAIDNDDPSVQEIVEQTRFSGVLRADEISGSPYLYIEQPGTEILTDVQYSAFKEDGTLHTVVLTTVDEFTDPSPSDMNDMAGHQAIAQEMSGTPTFYTLIVDTNNSELYMTSYTWGKNVQVLDPNVINNLNKGCILSEWTMPMFKLLESN